MKFERIAAALADAGQPPLRPAKPVPWDRRRRCARHAPASHGRGRKAERIVPLARLFQQQGHRAAAFRGKLQPAGRGHCHPPGLADHRAKAAVAEPFLHHGEQFGIIARLGVNDALRVQARLVEPRSEQVAGADRPQHRPLGARGNGRHEQRRRGIVAPAAALPRHFVKRVQAEALVGEAGIDVLHAEREHRTTPLA